MLSSIHSTFNFSTTLFILSICGVVGYKSWTENHFFWSFIAAGFAVFIFWPDWPNQAYHVIKNFITLNPEGAHLLAAIVFLAVVAWGCKHVFFGDKRTKHRNWF